MHPATVGAPLTGDTNSPFVETFPLSPGSSQSEAVADVAYPVVGPGEVKTRPILVVGPELDLAGGQCRREPPHVELIETHLSQGANKSHSVPLRLSHSLQEVSVPHYVVTEVSLMREKQRPGAGGKQDLELMGNQDTTGCNLLRAARTPLAKNYRALKSEQKPDKWNHPDCNLDGQLKAKIKLK